MAPGSPEMGGNWKMYVTSLVSCDPANPPVFGFPSPTLSNSGLFLLPSV